MRNGWELGEGLSVKQGFRSKEKQSAPSKPPMAPSRSSSEGILSRISDSSIMRKGKSVASDAAYVGKRLLKSTGKAAWISATTVIVLVLPLIIEMDREAQFNEADLQQAALLGAPSSTFVPQPH